MSKLDSFYFDLFNITKHNDAEEKIIQILNHLMSEIFMLTDDLSGLCKLISSQLEERLTSANINCKTIRINELTNCEYEHNSVIANYKNDRGEVEYLLLDPTFKQFNTRSKKSINNKLKELPAIKLNVANTKLNEALLTAGYCKVDEKELTDYLQSFDPIYDQIKTKEIFGDVLMKNR